MMNKRSVFLPLIIALSVVAGIFIAGLIAQDNRSMFAVEQAKSNKLNAMLDFISENYVDTVAKAEIIEQAIPKFLEQLDPHSVYIPAEDLKAMNEPLEGSFEGIGIQFNMKNDTLQVLHIISGGPSQKAGLLPGDQIISVDDSIIAGVDVFTQDVMKMLKGEKGSVVKVGVLRPGNNELLYFEIIRDKIPIYSVDVAYMPTSNIGYIKISSFSHTTYNEFIEAVNLLKTQGMKKLILDLRSNTGGIMDAATKIADEFLPGGKMIVYTQGRKHGKIETMSTDNYRQCVNLDLAVLIDEFSASASEIVAGAIQDNDRGWIIGHRSFGKGLVQEPVKFNDGSALRLTIARYYTPSGRCIQKDYGNDLEDYYSDIYNRYANGELTSVDSTHFDDSLKYYTPEGRIVYGGGGIMPDIFVPIDTSMNDLYFKIRNRNLVYEFAFEYTRLHRDVLSQYSNAKSLESHLKSKQVFNEFTEFVKSSGIQFSAQNMSESQQYIEVQLYASIARNILNDEGFYPIIHRIDDDFLKAKSVLESNRQLGKG
jgi:carboxyl-terminal processing protease